MDRLKLGVVGAGLIGKRHAECIAIEPKAMLFAIVDPSPVGRQLAATLNTAWFPNFAEMTAAGRPDGVIIATPNQLHLQTGLEAVAARVPAIVEKPIADSVAAAAELVEAAEKAGTPLLVGHHRRYNPMIRKAKTIIDSGRLGKIIAVHGAFWAMKPDDYFDVAWRREKGAGPILINLIHDVDLFRFFCGEVIAVQAMESSALRGNSIEDTAAILLRFANGAIGSLDVSDSIVAPWSWELTTGENPIYPRQDQFCYLIGGTNGSLTIPQLEIWENRGRRSWYEPLERDRAAYDFEDPLRAQIRHFCDVVRGETPPMVPAREGLNTLRVVEAVKESARRGATVEIR